LIFRFGLTYRVGFYQRGTPPPFTTFYLFLLTFGLFFFLSPVGFFFSPFCSFFWLIYHPVPVLFSLSKNSNRQVPTENVFPLKSKPSVLQNDRPSSSRFSLSPHSAIGFVIHPLTHSILRSPSEFKPVFPAFNSVYWALCESPHPPREVVPFAVFPISYFSPGSPFLLLLVFFPSMSSSVARSLFSIEVLWRLHFFPRWCFFLYRP